MGGLGYNPSYLEKVHFKLQKRDKNTYVSLGINRKGFKGGLAWIKPSKKDMAVTFSYCSLEY